MSASLKNIPVDLGCDFALPVSLVSSMFVEKASNVFNSLGLSYCGTLTVDGVDCAISCALDFCIMPELPVDVVVGRDWYHATRQCIATPMIPLDCLAAYMAYHSSLRTVPSENEINPIMPTHAGSSILSRSLRRSIVAKSYTMDNLFHQHDYLTVSRFFVFTDDFVLLKSHMEIHNLDPANSSHAQCLDILVTHLCSGACATFPLTSETPLGC